MFSIFTAACCGKDRTDSQLRDFICDTVAEQCPGGGGELDTNFLNDNLLQDANRIHDFATFTHVWNNVGSIDSNAIGHHNFVTSVGADAAVVSTNTSFKAQLHSTDGTALSRVFAQPLVSQIDVNDGLANFASVSIEIGAGGEPQVFVRTKAVDEATAIVGQVLTLQALTGEVEFATAGGGADQNLFETIAVSGQTSVVADSTTDTLTLVAGTGITITTDAATDSITINATGSVSLCDADLDTCFINELTPDEDWIRFSIGITDVKVMAGFINDENAAYGRGALGAMTTKTGDNVGIGPAAGGDITTGTSNVYVGKNAGLGSVIAQKNVAIGTDALSHTDTENTGWFGNIAIGFEAGMDMVRQPGNNDAAGNIIIGYQAMKGAGDISGGGPIDCIAIGFQVMQNVPRGAHSIAIGDAVMRPAEFARDSVVIGHDAVATFVGDEFGPIFGCDENVVIGVGAASSSTEVFQTVSIGWNAGKAIVNRANVIIGWGANGGDTTLIPSSLVCTHVGAASGFGMGGIGNISIGHLAGDKNANVFGTANTTLTNCMFIGDGTWYKSDLLTQAHAIGHGVACAIDNSIILGYKQAQSGVPDPIQYKIGVGTDSPTADFHVVTTGSQGFRFVDGNELADRVLTSDGAGNARWADSTGGGAGAGSYRQTFVVPDWVSGATDTLTVTAVTHGLGVGVHAVHVFDSLFDEVEVEVNVNKTTGDVVLTVPAGSAFDGELIISSGGSPGATFQVAHIAHSTPGTGGAGTVDTWNARIFNFEDDPDAIVIITPATNRFTLLVGEYIIDAQAAGFECANHMLRIQNITTATMEIRGLSAWSGLGSDAQTMASLSGRLTVTNAAHEYALEHFTKLTTPTDGLGRDVIAGIDNIHASVKFTKIG